MLQIKNIKKKYKTGDLIQTALDDVSVNLRDNEFVAILGPSGSGKTTLLNIIGGLDRYDSGDLIINGVSTKKYKDRDWDSYRNHTIGFVFQSYNLIPHQSVLRNVELALTISGVSRAERKKRAKEALDKVGLGGQYHKKPNQMSGGQMQRVAIARALVNNPDILLADEPTGALDTETSVQVMELLKEVAKDRLVVMVTHNPELAEQYSTRIIKLRDGVITDDSAPFEPETDTLKEPFHKNMGKAKMSFFTSLSLSFNNLLTKKGRTVLTSFAGSIGIIGIALILSLSNGVNVYINDIQKSTMTSYPITIEKQSVDLTSLIKSRQESVKEQTEQTEIGHDLDGVYSNGEALETASEVTTSIAKNNLTEFKKYIDNKDSEINKYIGENGVIYSYDTKFGVYTYDSDETFVNTDGSTLEASDGKSASGSAVAMSGMHTQASSGQGSMSMMSSMYNSDGKNANFSELLPDQSGKGISKAITDNYDVVYGNWPKEYNDVVLVLDKNNEISVTTLYQLGILPSKEYKELIKKMNNGEKLKIETTKYSYEDIIKQELYMIPACDTYIKGNNGNFKSVSDDTAEMKEIMKTEVKLNTVGVVRLKADVENALISSPVGYTRNLTNYLIDYAEKSDIVKAQRANTEKNILNGVSFSPDDDSAKIKDTKNYLENLDVSEKATMCKTIMQSAYANNEQAMQSVLSMSEQQLAAMLDNYLLNPDNETLLKIYDAYISAGSLDNNLESFGVVSLDAPSSISIYTDSFENKDSISDCISDYNATASKENKITYTDYVGLLMSSITTIINVISYVLIAFVAVSLIVSSIMIGIITYISVLERTKEIGILRALGASKHNISQVFNAETFIIGLLAGLIGVGISLLVLIPGNILIHNLAGTADVSASLPAAGAVILVVLSMLLTLIGGIIPAKKAAKKDPVTALRTE